MADLSPEGPSLDSVIEAYIRFGLERNDDDFWGWEEFTDIVWGDSEGAWAALLELVARAPDELLDYIGAGPVEDLVRAHPEEFVVRMAEQAKLDPRFNEALSCIWLGQGTMPGEMEQILQKATDHRIYIVPKSRE